MIQKLILNFKFMVFGLDNDDMYFDDDVFDFIYKKGKRENLDIILNFKYFSMEKE